MEAQATILKAIADDTRWEIVKLLLHRNYCVKALARRLGLTEAAVSQHLKVLREAGLLVGEKHGYFRHYDVSREELLRLSAYFQELAGIEREACNPESENCAQSSRKNCHVHSAHRGCLEEAPSGPIGQKRCGRSGHCGCRKPEA